MCQGGCQICILLYAFKSKKEKFSNEKKDLNLEVGDNFNHKMRNKNFISKVEHLSGHFNEKLNVN